MSTASQRQRNVGRRHSLHNRGTSMRRLATVITSITAFLFLDSAARADVTVCNDICVPIHVAFAYQDQGNFRAAGGWLVEPNCCEEGHFPLQGSPLYYW